MTTRQEIEEPCEGKLSSTVLKTSQQGQPSGLVQQDGLINVERLRETFVKYLPSPSGGKRMVVGIDGTPIPRPFSHTSPDRTVMPMHNIPHTIPKKSTALTFGWKYSTVMVFPETPSSWTYILDQQRISSDKTDIQVAFEQLQQLVPLFSTRLLVLLDRGGSLQLVVVPM